MRYTRRLWPKASTISSWGPGSRAACSAERLASERNRRVLVVEKRPHIAGNTFDTYDENSILVHRYGPHIFHTNSKRVFEYLSRFTAWRPYQHRVRALVDGQLVPIPINLDTINQLYGLKLNSFELERFFAERAEVGRRSPHLGRRGGV